MATGVFGPQETAELRDTLSYATLHLMERLSPPERAVFVLREGFDLPYDAIAEIVGISAAGCRQLHLATLTDLLSEDIVAWNDGGGRVRAALRPVAGRDRVLAFIQGLLARYAMGEVRLIEANGEPALWTTIDGSEQFVAFDVCDGHIHGIFAVLNPDKLTRVHR